jgi:NAD(P)-dependent dehydrogenase (short-subunit alcohol dehydrogenase family)
MGKLSGKVAWITGGGNGIGEAGARTLAEAGASMIVSGRGHQELDRVAEATRIGGDNAEAVPADVADPEAIQHLFGSEIESAMVVVLDPISWVSCTGKHARRAAC